MAATSSAAKLFTEAAIVTYDHDPGTTAALITSPDGGTTKRYVDMADYAGFAGVVMATIATGGPTLVDIVGAEDAAGTNVTTIVSSGAVVADAVGDGVVIECTAEQVKEVAVASGYTLRYVGIRITCANSADECAVTYIRFKPRFPKTALTANFIS